MRIVAVLLDLIRLINHPPKVIQALFFDAAGTLIEPAEPVAETYSRLLSPHLGELDPALLGAAFGPAFKSAGHPKYSEFPDGDSAERHWWREVVDSTVSQNVPEKAFHEVFEHYARASAWRLFPEVRSVLAQAAEMGLKCAVVSNFDLRLHQILKQMDLSFDLTVTSADASARKPSPAIFSEALQSLGIGADEVLHVGDSEQADLEGANAAGISAYLLKRPANDLADFIGWVRNHP